MRTLTSAPLSSRRRIRSRTGARSTPLSLGTVLVVVVHVQVAVFDRRPERRPAPEVVGVHVRAPLGEESGDVDLAIERGHQQRTNAVAITQFELGSGGDEHPCRLQPPVASGIQKRRHAAFHFGTPAAVRQTALIDADPFRSAARALARRHERRRRPLARLAVHRGAGLDEQFNGSSVILTDRDHQRRLLEFRLACVHGGATLDEQAQGGHRASARGGHQRRFAAWISGIGIDARVEEPPDHLGIAVDTGEEERCHAVAIAGAGVRTGPQQQIRNLQMVRMHGGVQSGGPVDTGGVDVAPLPDEGSDGREISPLRGIGQRNAGRHRDGRQQPSDQDREGENVSRRHLGILSRFGAALRRLNSCRRPAVLDEKRVLNAGGRGLLEARTIRSTQEPEVGRREASDVREHERQVGRRSRRTTTPASPRTARPTPSGSSGRGCRCRSVRSAAAPERPCRSVRSRRRSRRRAPRRRRRSGDCPTRDRSRRRRRRFPRAAACGRSPRA